MTTKEERREWIFASYAPLHAAYCDAYHALLRELSAYILAGDEHYGVVVQTWQLADFVVKFIQKRFSVYADHRSCWYPNHGAAWNVFVLAPVTLVHRCCAERIPVYKGHVRWVNYRVQKEKKHGMQELPQ